jgi:hypothetical protein
MTKNKKIKTITAEVFCYSLILGPSKRTSEAQENPSALKKNIQHFKT